MGKHSKHHMILQGVRKEVGNVLAFVVDFIRIFTGLGITAIDFCITPVCGNQAPFMLTPPKW